MKHTVLAFALAAAMMPLTFAAQSHASKPAASAQNPPANATATTTDTNVKHKKAKKSHVRKPKKDATGTTTPSGSPSK